MAGMLITSVRNNRGRYFVGSLSLTTTFAILAVVGFTHDSTAAALIGVMGGTAALLFLIDSLANYS